MTHLLISREYPPAPYSGGGIGTYVQRIAHLLAEHGETVHVIGQLSPAAMRRKQVLLGGRLTIHRVALDAPIALPPAVAKAHQDTLDAFRRSVLPSQAFQWQAALVAERLIEDCGIDVVEAQDYEAPLYFLMLRRALGLGPIRRVPLIVHLHSPTEFIYRANECDERPDYGPLTRLENYVIRGADALVSPSLFLAELAASHFGVPRDSIAVIPYPLEDAPVIPRQASTWREGAVCYVGRLEPRKGVFEWVDAAAAHAARNSTQQFTFVGNDSFYGGMGDRSVRQMLQDRIPDAVRARFQFHDAVPRPRLAMHRQQARIGVVPSRWDNFPYACVEAMASGLPVIVSPLGGTAEMVEDGRTGWIAAGADSKALEDALRRAVDVPPAVLAEMGASAAASIRERCDARTIVARHLAFRRQVIDGGARRSSPMPTPAPDAVLLSPEQPHLESIAQARIGSFRGDRTTTPADFLRGTNRERMALLRRSLLHPGYVVRWCAWHGLGTLDRAWRWLRRSTGAER